MMFTPKVFLWTLDAALPWPLGAMVVASAGLHGVRGGVVGSHACYMLRRGLREAYAGHRRGLGEAKQQVGAERAPYLDDGHATDA